jgi:hypothetical protein
VDDLIAQAEKTRTAVIPGSIEGRPPDGFNDASGSEVS